MCDFGYFELFDCSIKKQIKSSRAPHPMQQHTCPLISCGQRCTWNSAYRSWHHPMTDIHTFGVAWTMRFPTTAHQPRAL